MLFTAPVFLFGYLPAVLAGFALMPRRWRHTFLFLASLGFYAWSERRYVLVLVASILLNTKLALLVQDSMGRLRRVWLTLAVILNVGVLAYFKYYTFFMENVSWVLGRVGVETPAAAPVHLPIAISFITFEALSYVIDVYRGETMARRNPIHVGLYVSVFPHLIAGPILRFDDIAPALDRPEMQLDRFASGARTFILGLAKKILIANTAAQVADRMFENAGVLSPGAAWLGAVCYALEIYFDFSGYSDMAIGLGRLFGFELPRNFNLPYSARSIRDFWRRWHISLSTWFRDYLYIPLGGNRAGELRGYLNLLIVFFLCGLWHGASWTFVIWGLYHGAFLVLERLFEGAWLDRLWRPLQHVYAMTVVLVGWVFFRAETLSQALTFLASMFGMTAGQTVVLASDLASRELLLALLIGVPVATLPSADWLHAAVAKIPGEPGIARSSVAFAGAAIHVGLLIVSFVALAASTHQPFIYFRF